MKILAALGIAGALLAIAAAAFVWSGLYDISATDQHLRPTYFAMRKTMERSVERRAKAIAVPPLGDAAQLARGVALFRAHCVQCHGAPGVAPEPFSLALRPLPTPLVRTGRERSPAYVYWVVRNGIKMTAMPAWEFRLSEEEIWAVVAFVGALPKLSPRDYSAMRGTEAPKAQTAATYASDTERGRHALEQYGCAGCHQIPGVLDVEARVGPTLHGIARRETLGGVLPNTPENMVRWIRAPREFSPETAMPALGVTERDARDMAAYLATLK